MTDTTTTTMEEEQVVPKSKRAREDLTASSSKPVEIPQHLQWILASPMEGSNVIEQRLADQNQKKEAREAQKLMESIMKNGSVAVNEPMEEGEIPPDR